MSRFFAALLTVFCFTAVAQKSAAPDLLKHNMTQEVLLNKMEKAVDPKGSAKKWKTAIIKMQLEIPMQQNKVLATAMYKFPDKSKSIAVVPGMPIVTQVFDGKQAWKETAGLGLQMKTGVQLAFAKFECKKSNPALSPKDVYEKITLDPYLYKMGKFVCYKLTCSLPVELKVSPSQLFVDNKEFLIRSSIENQLTEMGAIPVRIEFSDIKTMSGVKTPMRVSMNMMGIKMIGKILSIKINEKIADSEFKLPGK